MKIFSADQIRKADQYTIENELILSINLMERAAQKCVNWLNNIAKNNESFVLFCGSGNNGGDGLAMARLLYENGYDVDVFIDKTNKKFSDDAKINLQKIKELSGIDIHDFSEANHFYFRENSILIDAIFGTGLNRKIEGNAKSLIEFLNTLKLKKISVDLPSGLSADHYLEGGPTIFLADDTLSFQFWKKTFLHPETGKFCGNVHILDIGLSQGFIEKTITHEFVVEEIAIRKMYKPRTNFAHKGNFGNVCIIAGSYGKIGAAVLATKAALKCGSGLTFSLSPNCGYTILQTSCPEAMFLYGGENFINHIHFQEDFTYGIGPGLGIDPETESNFLEFLKNCKKPLVLDADALNILAKNPLALSLIPKNSIITPHPKEFGRLFGNKKTTFESLELAKRKAEELGIVIVLKDHRTKIVTPKKEVYYNMTGNSGMAKGGSGDALTGIITSLLSQGYSSVEAAVFGVWLHGKAGDFAAKKCSKEAMLATDLVENIGDVFKFLS